VAQRESTPFTRVGSQVQSLSRPPCLSPGKSDIFDAAIAGAICLCALARTPCQQRVEYKYSQRRRQIRVSQAGSVDLADEGGERDVPLGGDAGEFVQEGFFERKAGAVAANGDRALFDSAHDSS